MKDMVNILCRQKLICSRRGFSMVETVLALGIVSFAMMGIVGLIPMGLGHFRDAMWMNAETQILQRISNDLLLTEYQDLVSAYSSQQDFYFNDQAKALESDSDKTRLYQARVTLNDLSAPGLPGSSGKTATIMISRIDRPGFEKAYSLFIPQP